MKLNLRPKHHNYTQNKAYPLATQNSPLSPYSGALELQFAPSPLYTFVSLSLMVLYQFKSLNLDDYNLTYSQNKNMGFEIFLTTPLKLHHFLYIKIPQNQSKAIKTMQKNLKLNKNHPRTLYTKLGFFSKPKHKKRGVLVRFPYLNFLKASSFFFLNQA